MASVSCTYSPVTRCYPSIHRLTPFILSKEYFKTSHDLSFRVPKNRSPMPVLSMRQDSAVLEVTPESSWNPSILKSETPVLVEFYTRWCEPCQMVHELLDEIATDYPGQLERVAVDVEQEPRVAEEYDIKAVPIVVLFKNGEKRESVVGTMPKEFFVAAIERVLAG